MSFPQSDQWIRDLSEPGPRREERVSELRAFLVAGLRRALAGRFHADATILEDFVQEAILRILGRLDSFRGESRFTTWAMSVAIRVAFSEMRQRHWQEKSLEAILENSDLIPSGLEEPNKSSNKKLMQGEILAVLDRVIREQLTERQRQALLAELKGMPLEIVAAKMNTNRNALYKLLHDARLKLKRGLQEKSVTPDEVRSTFDL